MVPRDTMNISEDNTTHNVKNYLLDPLSVIIKLAIIGNKPVGTKIHIVNNNIQLQEPGPFQAICRYVLKTNKTDLHYLYNPIYLACFHFLTRENIEKTPRLRNLFICGLKGIDRLIETYSNCSIIRLTLYFYHVIISNFLDNVGDTNTTVVAAKTSGKNTQEPREQKYNFRKDMMSPFYTEEMVRDINMMWTQDRIKVILNLIDFLSADQNSESNVKSLENIMIPIDYCVFERLNKI